MPYGTANSKKTLPNVRRLRARLGLSRRALAKALGASETALHRWEHGRAPGKHFVPRLRELAVQARTGKVPRLRLGPADLGPLPDLRALRRKLDVSRRAVAKFLGVGEASIANWETGFRRPQKWHLARLRDFAATEIPP